jgi:hypothetical protein
MGNKYKTYLKVRKTWYVFLEVFLDLNVKIKTT